MLEFLKKIGLPATVAAVIASVVTVAPFLFKIDERYAKESVVKAQEERTIKALNEMTIEIGKLAGSQEATLAILSNMTRAQREQQRTVLMKSVEPTTSELRLELPPPKKIRNLTGPAPTSLPPVPVPNDKLAPLPPPPAPPALIVKPDEEQHPGKKLEGIREELNLQQNRLRSQTYRPIDIPAK